MRVSRDSKESTYNIRHGFVILLISKENTKEIYATCINDLQLNISNSNLSECNIKVYTDKNNLSYDMKKYIDEYDMLFYVVEGTIYSDVSLTDFIIRIKEGE